MNSEIPHRLEPIYLVGPTGVGKSSFACDLAERIGAEIIGADAFQIYDGLPVLTAQPSVSLRQRVKHHLVGILPLTEAFDVAAYLALANHQRSTIHAAGHIPLVVGGTGLYVKALTSGLSASPPGDPALRAELSLLPLPKLIERLKKVDTDAPAQVDIQNRRRVERAIEICELSGSPLASFRNQPPPAGRGIFLMRDPEELHKRIAANIAEMFALGVVDEVRAASHAGPTARKAIGFSAVEALIQGTISEKECRDRILVATRQYAKRQRTWFRHQSPFAELNITGLSYKAALARIVNEIENLLLVK